MFVCGLDIGAATTKAVILQEGKILSYFVLPTGQSVNAATHKAMEEVTKRVGIGPSDLECLVTTGYGRHSVPAANRAVSEIVCHAKGANFVLPSARTVIDIGGQDSKIMAMDEAGNVTNFAMNDKCAAGTGRFIEVMANVLEIPLEDMGKLSLTSKQPAMISSTCTVFAESEVVSLRARGEPRENLVAGIHKAVASRTITMGRSVGFTQEVAFTGGVAKNVGVKHYLEIGMGTQLIVPEEPQIIGALGAALLALDGKR